VEGESRRQKNVEGLVWGLLELVFWPPLPKFEVGGQVGGPVGDVLTPHIMV
jgi:hypothetical protein